MRSGGFGFSVWVRVRVRVEGKAQALRLGLEGRVRTYLVLVRFCMSRNSTCIIMATGGSKEDSIRGRVRVGQASIRWG
jgi:hypothetical protein